MTIIRRTVPTAAAAAAFGIAGVLGPAVSGSAQPASASTTTAVDLSSHHRLPAVAVDWAAVWNGNDPQCFAALFAKDGSRYTDHAFGRTFSGQLLNAPKPFSVPVATILRLRGNKILANDDYYNMKDVLIQSGLPADTVFG
ncbi:hypothetical protein ACWGKQ_49750 [Streptomyces sp. NPDC054770]